MKTRKVRYLRSSVSFLKLLVASGAATTAHAQSSVLLYGLLDAGIQYKTNTTAQGSSSWTSSSANASYPSRFGLKGSEDLGGGYRAIFQLENGFQLNSGALASSDTLFNRMAYVGFSSEKLGSVTFGRQYSVQYDKTVFYEPTLFNNYSIFSLNIIPPATVRVNNAVKYQSPELHGFNLEAMYSFGQQVPGSFSAGKYWGIGGEYVTGGFWTRVVYEQVNGTLSAGLDQSGKVDRRTSIAARYIFDPFSVYAGVVTVRGSLQASPNGNIYWAAGQYMPNPFLKLIVEGGRYVFKENGGRPTLLSASALYWLSKSTTVYLTGGYFINGGGSSFGVTNYTTTPSAGMTQLGVAAGLIKRF
ncbi:porin [Paraburkholderia bannensis]|uniref:porin n=1 Tax=Paraburkholderia bannensis TaxID=765414 RepID=UPI002ABD957B|nr:porin [Paraburkholderia bannensis]